MHSLGWNWKLVGKKYEPISLVPIQEYMWLNDYHGADS